MYDMCIVRKYPELLQQFKYLLGYKDHGSLDPFAGLSGISSLLAAKDRTSEYRDSSQNSQKSEAGVAVERPTEGAVLSDVEGQQLEARESSEESLKSRTI